MIILHHLNNSRSQRVLWLLEELQLPYEIKYYQRDKKTSLAPEELRQIHPLGKSPIITDKDVTDEDVTDGEVTDERITDEDKATHGKVTDDKITIAESGAIIEYLCRVYDNGSIRPVETSKAHLDYQYWLHFSEGTMMPPLLLKLILQKVKEKSPPLLVKTIAKGIVEKVNQGYIMPNITRQLAFVDTHLKMNPWFAGEQLTGADIQMSFPLEAAVHGGLCENYPAIKAWVAKIHSREAYKTALSKGGEYQFAS